MACFACRRYLRDITRYTLDDFAALRRDAARVTPPCCHAFADMLPLPLRRDDARCYACMPLRAAACHYADATYADVYFIAAYAIFSPPIRLRHVATDFSA